MNNDNLWGDGSENGGKSALEIGIVIVLVLVAAIELIYKVVPRDNKEEAGYEAVVDRCVSDTMPADSLVADASMFVDEDGPTYPGGMEALQKYLAENIEYPEVARENNITGKVYVSFVIEKDGSVGEVHLLRDIGGGCGGEAMRVVRSMPRWEPAMQDGVPVRTEFVLPVNFDLR